MHNIIHAIETITHLQLTGDGSQLQVEDICRLLITLRLMSCNIVHSLQSRGTRISIHNFNCVLYNDSSTLLLLQDYSINVYICTDTCMRVLTGKFDL